MSFSLTLVLLLLLKGAEELKDRGEEEAFRGTFLFTFGLLLVLVSPGRGQSKM